MSKGHNAHRRRAYGRRQHELRERRTPRQTWGEPRAATGTADGSDVLGSFDELRSSPARFAVPFGARWLPETG